MTTAFAIALLIISLGLLFMFVLSAGSLLTEIKARKAHDRQSSVNYAPQWDEEHPAYVTMGSSRLRAINIQVPGHPDWKKAVDNGYNEYFEVDLHTKTHAVEVYRQGPMMFVCIGILNQTNAQEFEFGFSNEHHRGWENVIQFLNIIDPDYIQVIE